MSITVSDDNGVVFHRQNNTNLYWSPGCDAIYPRGIDCLHTRARQHQGLFTEPLCFNPVKLLGLKRWGSSPLEYRLASFLRYGFAEYKPNMEKWVSNFNLTVDLSLSHGERSYTQKFLKCILIWSLHVYFSNICARLFSQFCLNAFICSSPRFVQRFRFFFVKF